VFYNGALASNIAVFTLKAVKNYLTEFRIWGSITDCYDEFYVFDITPCYIAAIFRIEEQAKPT
jgi:hypothetical protein